MFARMAAPGMLNTQSPPSLPQNLSAFAPFALRQSPIAVCHIVAADFWAGAEAQIAMLLANLSPDTDITLSAIVLGEGRLAEELRASNIVIKVIPRPRRRFLACYQEAAEFLRGRDLRILHSHKSKENLLAFLLAKKLGIAHLVRTQHGLPEPKTIKDRLVYGLERMTACSTSRIISVSSDLSKHLNHYVEGGKVEIILNGINPQQVSSPFDRESAKRHLGIPVEAIVIGTAARLEPVKRIDLFLATAENILKTLPYAVFIIAGEGSERKRLEKSLHGTACSSRVHFLGHREDIYNVLRAMDLLLITSDHEGLPTVLLEAMALGTPIVSRKVGGIPEVIEHEVSAVLVDSNAPEDLADACISLLSDPDLLKRTASAAREMVTQRFTGAQSAARLAQLYKNLVRPEQYSVAGENQNHD